MNTPLFSQKEQFGSRRLWSLWEMLTLDAKEFVMLLHTLMNIELQTRRFVGPVSVEFVSKADGVTDYLIGIMAPLDLPHSVKTAKNLMRSPKTYEEWHRGLENVTNSVMLELEGRKFYGPLRSFEKYYDQPKPFGDQVFDNFPSANEDLYEAGMCLALERGTACVMHLMRALEVALGVLAQTLGVTNKNDWGQYLKGIQTELDTRMKVSGARSPDEQFCAEVGDNFDRVRRAFRNPTMHPDKTYSQERAEEILLATKSFMTHLATHLME